MDACAFCHGRVFNKLSLQILTSALKVTCSLYRTFGAFILMQEMIEERSIMLVLGVAVVIA